MNVGVSEARRNRVKPACSTTRRAGRIRQAGGLLRGQPVPPPIVLAVGARHLGVEPFTRQPGVAAGGRCELVGGLGTADGQRPVPALR